MMLERPDVLIRVAAATISLLVSALAPAATIVRFDTPVGSFEIELLDDAAPISVENFLNYVRDGDYDGSFIHRSVPAFIIQGGGFTLRDGLIERVLRDPPIVNEAGVSNTRGTIAMAQFGTDPDSATSQWFINTVDNDGSGLNDLDTQNGGFAVFGRVRGDGMTVVDALAAIPIYDASGPPPNGLDSTIFQSLPLVEPTLFPSSFVFTDLSIVPAAARAEEAPLSPAALGLLGTALALVGRFRKVRVRAASGPGPGSSHA